MKIYNFEYDGIRLGDMGYTICSFDFSGKKTVSNGSQIKFNTVSTLRGAKFELTSAEYNTCLSTTFQICKSPCDEKELDITPEDLRVLMRWLNRKEFHKLKLFGPGYTDLYFEASFNINRIELNGLLYGLELEVTTNRPFALMEPEDIVIVNTEVNGVKTFSDTSDEEGFIYPHMEIEINKSGILSIRNSIEDREMVINNCIQGEVITLDYPIIQTSIASHKIQNDFNWTFFRIANAFNNRTNELTISLPCKIKMHYSPIVKMGL